MSSLFEMGQFGGFIWASYVIAAIALGWMFASSWSSAETLAKKLKNETADKDDNAK
jgi:heme exporter protein CcmD